MAQSQDSDETFTNEFGATLAEVRQASLALHDLLTESIPPEYDSKVQADKATVANLRYWRFAEEDIREILQHYRPSQRDSEFFTELVQDTTLTKIDPVHSPLGIALIESSKRNGGRPEASVATLREIQEVFTILGEQATASQIVESGFPKGAATQSSSIKRRVTRGLRLLERAGYVSHTEVGQLYVWHDEELESLSLPSSPHVEDLNL